MSLQNLRHIGAEDVNQIARGFGQTVRALGPSETDEKILDKGSQVLDLGLNIAGIFNGGLQNLRTCVDPYGNARYCPGPDIPYMDLQNLYVSVDPYGNARYTTPSFQNLYQYVTPYGEVRYGIPGDGLRF